MTKAEQKEYNRVYRLNTIAKGLCIRCRKNKPTNHSSCPICLEVGKVRTREYIRRNLDKVKLAKKRAYKLLREQAILAYGGYECACCGETEKVFLGLDHINGGGRAQRKEVGACSNMYAWLKKHNYPDGFRILCHNCNLGRHINGGVCPHAK